MQHLMITIGGEDYLTATEAAEFLGVSPATFAKFQREYKLKWMTRPGLSQRKFFRKKDLEPLLEFRPGEDGGESNAI